ASADGTATRYAMPAVDLGVEVAGIETRLAVLEAGGVGSAVPETIRFTAAQITEDIAASPPTPYRAYNNTGASQTITGVRLSVGVAPADGPVTVDVRVDGVSVFANPGDQPSVGVGVNTSGLVSPTGTATVPAGSYVTVVPTAGDDPAEAVPVGGRVGEAALIRQNTFVGTDEEPVTEANSAAGGDPFDTVDSPGVTYEADGAYEGVACLRLDAPGASNGLAWTGLGGLGDCAMRVYVKRSAA